MRIAAYHSYAKIIVKEWGAGFEVSKTFILPKTEISKYGNF